MSTYISSVETHIQHSPYTLPPPPEHAYASYRTGGPFVEIMRHCLLWKFLSRRVNWCAQLILAWSFRSDASTCSVMLQLGLLKVTMVVYAMKSSTLAHLHQTPILSKHLHQRRPTPESMKVAGYVSASRIAFPPSSVLSPTLQTTPLAYSLLTVKYLTR